MHQPAVEMQNVCKRFHLSGVHHSLRDWLTSSMSRVFGRNAHQTGKNRQPSRQPSEFWALRDVSFAVNQGESIGIIGPNGAGKSTALKLLTGILRPDRGSVYTRGRVAALIEVGAGFHGDLTGRENIYLNGSILGMNRREIRAKLDAIVDFSGIGRFVDEPVKRYSSGMYARLGFSIAAHVDPDVFLVDEVLSVGDAVFRLRCLDRMRSLLHSGTTLVFVTHNLDQMQAVCPQAMVLEQGQCMFHGLSKEAVQHYLKAMTHAYAARTTDLHVQTAGSGNDQELQLVSLRINDATGQEVTAIKSRQPVEVVLEIFAQRSILRLIVELNLREAHENLLSFNSGRDRLEFNVAPGRQTLTLHLQDVPLSGGQYLWNVRMWDADSGLTLIDTPLKFPMAVEDEGLATGKVVVNHNWTLTKSAAQSTVDCRIMEHTQSIPTTNQSGLTSQSEFTPPQTCNALHRDEPQRDELPCNKSQETPREHLPVR